MGIDMNLFEAASYSWNLNSNKGIVSRILLTAGASVSGLFSCYSINTEEVESLIREHPEYRECYFYTSLNKRGVKIDFFTLTSKLVIPEEYENHRKVVIDGSNYVGKNTFINALMGNKSSDAAPLGKDKQPITSTKFYGVDDNVVLCRVPKFADLEGKIREWKRYDDYDAVVFMIDATLSTSVCELIKIAKDAGKPYLVIVSMFDRYIDDFIYDYSTSDMSIDEISRIRKDRIFDKLTISLQKEDLMPGNKKLLLVSGRFVDKFDFKEASDLIKSNNFNGNSAD